MYQRNLYIEGLSNTFLQLKANPQKDSCFSHFAPDKIEVLSISANDSIVALFELLEKDWNIPNPILKLSFNLCLTIINKDTEEIHQILAPDFGLNDPRFVSNEIIQIETKLVKDMVHEIQSKIN